MVSHVCAKEQRLRDEKRFLARARAPTKEKKNDPTQKIKINTYYPSTPTEGGGVACFCRPISASKIIQEISLG